MWIFDHGTTLHVLIARSNVHLSKLQESQYMAKTNDENSSVMPSTIVVDGQVT